MPVDESALTGVITSAAEDHPDARLLREIEERVRFLTAPEYTDPSVNPLSRADYVWLLALCGVVPLIALIWGWSQM